MTEWATTVTPAKQAELRAYDPNWVDRIAMAIMGDERPSPSLARAIELAIGSRGMGTTGMSALGLTPLTAKTDMDQAQSTLGRIAAAMGVIPGAKPAAAAVKAAAERAAATSAARAGLPEGSQATLRAKGVSHTDVPMMREGDQLVPNPGYVPPSTPIARAMTEAEDPVARAAREWHARTTVETTPRPMPAARPVTTVPEPAQPAASGPMSQATKEKLGRPMDADPSEEFAAPLGHHPSLRDFQLERTMPNPWPGPSLSGETGAPRGSVWMVNARGEVRNSLEVPGTQAIDTSGKIRRDVDGWWPLYDEAAKKGRDLTPEEMAASRSLWGNPSGSLWDQAWMPTEAPQGVKEAVKSMAETPGRKWGDVLTDVIMKMRERGTPPAEIQEQLPAIAQAMARSSFSMDRYLSRQAEEAAAPKPAESGWKTWVRSENFGNVLRRWENKPVGKDLGEKATGEPEAYNWLLRYYRSYVPKRAND